MNVEEQFSKACGLPVTVINDADAAGYAVMNYGIGKGKQGLVIMVTIGTGRGSGVFLNGELVPNFELGQIPYKKYKKIESWAANSAKKREQLSFKDWGKRFNKFLELVELIVCPDLIILGGGTSDNFDEFKKYIKIFNCVVIDVFLPARSAGKKVCVRLRVSAVNKVILKILLILSNI